VWSLRRFFILDVCVWLVGRPPGPFMYGVGPAQRGFGLQPHGWRPPFQFAGHAALPVSRPPLSVGPRLGPDAAATQRPPITQQSTAGQQGMQFVPTQVIIILQLIAGCHVTLCALEIWNILATVVSCNTLILVAYHIELHIVYMMM